MNFNTEQEVFDFVVEVIIKQGRPSVDPSAGKHVRCLYRGPGGEKCAAGHLITDDDMNSLPFIENRSIEAVREDLPDDHVINKFPTLVWNLQSAHDKAAMLHYTEGHNFIGSFEEIAKTIVDNYENLVWRH